MQMAVQYHNDYWDYCVSDRHLITLESDFLYQSGMPVLHSDVLGRYVALNVYFLVRVLAIFRKMIFV